MSGGPARLIACPPEVAHALAGRPGPSAAPARIVLDGAPGSGKTSLLFGRGSHDLGVVVRRSLSSLGFAAVEESIHPAFEAISADGRKPYDHGEEAMRGILAREVANFGDGHHRGIVLHDRGLPGYEYIIRQRLRLETQPWFDRLVRCLRYASPVFVLAPLPWVDLARPGPFRVWTLGEREAFHAWLLERYRDLGYRVVEVPAFSEHPELDAAEKARLVVAELAREGLELLPMLRAG